MLFVNNMDEAITRFFQRVVVSISTDTTVILLLMLAPRMHRLGEIEDGLFAITPTSFCDVE